MKCKITGNNTPIYINIKSAVLGGRKNKDDITVADLTGTGVQDTAIARYVYSIALNKNLGKNIE